MFRRSLLLALACVSFSGCLYTNVNSPREYRSATPADVHASPSDKAVTGTACAHSLLYLVAWGDEGYAAAVDAAMKDEPAGLMYDVRSDILVQSYVLGLYSRVCTTVTGRAARS
jgi:hypothetical protein